MSYNSSKEGNICQKDVVVKFNPCDIAKQVNVCLVIPDDGIKVRREKNQYYNTYSTSSQQINNIIDLLTKLFNKH